VAEDYWNVAETRMYYMIQNVELDKKEELRQIEENLSVRILLLEYSDILT
jgi:hypothetical protein